MPDLTMCNGRGCPQASQCYRHIANPTPLTQSWFAETPGNDAGCDFFIEVRQPLSTSNGPVEDASTPPR